MTTLSQNNTVAGSLVLNDYIISSLQNTDVIGKETAVGRFEDAPPLPDGPLDHTLKPRSGNGGACSSLAMPRVVEAEVPVPRSGAFKKRCALRIVEMQMAQGLTDATPASCAGTSSLRHLGSFTSEAICRSRSITPVLETS